MHNLHQLYVEQLRDLYSAETQLIDALPKMAQAAASSDLKKAFDHHLEQTRGHIQRLEKVFAAMDTSPEGETCEAMQGLIKEGEAMMGKDGDAAVKDAALIAQAQRIEHYEIAGYGTVCAYAEQLSQQNAHKMLRETLDEEKHADEKLNKLATGSINKQAKSVQA